MEKGGIIITRKELCDKFLTEEESFLYQEYREKLHAQLQLWISYPTDMGDDIIRIAIALFVEEQAKYDFDTDCYIAIVGCMRAVVIEYIHIGKIAKEYCCPFLQEYIQDRKNINMIGQKQLNIVLSNFNRKMFDYFINRYYFMRDIPYNKRMEKKIARLFQGKGNVRPLYVINRFKSVTCTSSAYIQYLTLIDPVFVAQIGKGTFMILQHSDADEYYYLQIMSNNARRALPFIVLMIIVMLIVL